MHSCLFVNYHKQLGSSKSKGLKEVNSHYSSVQLLSFYPLLIIISRAFNEFWIAFDCTEYSCFPVKRGQIFIAELLECPKSHIGYPFQSYRYTCMFCLKVYLILSPVSFSCSLTDMYKFLIKTNKATQSSFYRIQELRHVGCLFILTLLLCKSMDA